MKISEYFPETCKYKPKNYDLNINEWVDGYLSFPDYSHSTVYKGCEEPVWEDDPEGKYCIYHSRNREKPEFQMKFTEKYIENFYNSSRFRILHDYIGFVFPKEFNFSKFFKDVRKNPKVREKIQTYYEEIGTHLIDVNFYGAIFHCDADFAGEKFYGYHEGTNFMYAKFMGENGANFTLSEFTGEGQVSFYFAQFLGCEVRFYWTKFSNRERINFSRAIFVGEGQAKFQHSVFKGDNYVEFENTFFSMLNGLSFRYARFTDGIKVFFRKTQFDGTTIVDFRELYLEEADKILFNSVDISRCMFSDTYIRDIEFRETYLSPDFSEELRTISIFKRSRVFDEVLFEDPEEKTFMRMMTFLRKSRYEETLDKIIESFSNDIFWEDKLLHMVIDEHRSQMSDDNVIDLHNSLRALSDEIKGIDTNIHAKKVRRRKLIEGIINKIEDRDIRDVWWRLIHLIKTDDGVVFQKIRGNLNKIEEEDNRVIRLIAEIKNEQYKEQYKIKQIYSQLRLNFEDSGRYNEAGDFFIGEMEMRRKGDEPKWRRRVLSLYKCLSLYGERPLLAIAWILLLWVLFGFLNIFAGMVPDKDYFEKFAICYGSINWNFDFGIIKRTFIGIKTIVLQKDDKVLTSFIDYFFTSWKGFFETLNVMRHDLGDGLRVVISNATLGRFEAPYTLSPRSVWCTILKVVEFLSGAITIPLFVLAMNRKFRRTKD